MGSGQLGSTWLELGLAWVCFGLARLGSDSGLGLGSARARASRARACSRLDSAWLGPVPVRFRPSQHGSVWLGLARKSMHLLATHYIICRTTRTTRTESSMIAFNYANRQFGCGVGLARLCFSSSRLGLGVCSARLGLARSASQAPLGSARF